MDSSTGYILDVRRGHGPRCPFLVRRLSRFTCRLPPSLVLLVWISFSIALQLALFGSEDVSGDAQRELAHTKIRRSVVTSDSLRFEVLGQRTRYRHAASLASSVILALMFTIRYHLLHYDPRVCALSALCPPGFRGVACSSCPLRQDQLNQAGRRVRHRGGDIHRPLHVEASGERRDERVTERARKLILLVPILINSCTVRIRHVKYVCNPRSIRCSWKIRGLVLLA